MNNLNDPAPDVGRVARDAVFSGVRGHHLGVGLPRATVDAAVEDCHARLEQARGQALAGPAACSDAAWLQSTGRSPAPGSLPARPAPSAGAATKAMQEKLARRQ
jgi:hypothetical protein